MNDCPSNVEQPPCPPKVLENEGLLARWRSRFPGLPKTRQLMRQRWSGGSVQIDGNARRGTEHEPEPWGASGEDASALTQTLDSTTD
jgi:hypothetical protein